MRHLLLLRHAKSSWANPELPDFDRPLNKRGQRSAKALGRWLHSNGTLPELVYCSSARRTRETWDGLKLPGEVAFRDDLYEADSGAVLDVVRACPTPSLLVIGHNPGLADLAHSLARTAPAHARWSDYPTGALTSLRFEVSAWADLVPGTGTVEAFLTPHDLAPTA
ncbi:MAG: histidine phosphatase family protein [Pseudomonadota bacterium]